MHNLDKWIINNSLSRQLFAKKINISTATLSRYLSGDRIPKQEIMEKIVKITRGSISPDDFYITKNNNIFINNFKKKHLLGIEGLNKNEISSILNRADDIVTKNKVNYSKDFIYKGKTLVNLFFEDSTRTKTSFELAAKRLGLDVINMQIETSSIRKGESLLDTAMTLNAMRPDILVIRHALSGTPHLLANKVKCSVINAGDGKHEHPTQALLDALAIRKRKKKN